MITREVINQAIDYILQHTEEELTLDEVAEHCHFSKFYFSRLFKEQTGESVYAYIRRIKLEQSAFRLKVEKERRITEISADYGTVPRITALHSGSTTAWRLLNSEDGAGRNRRSTRFSMAQGGRQEALRNVTAGSGSKRYRIIM